jgi:hypothetical protein
MVLPFFPRRVGFANRGSGKGEEPGGEKDLRLIQIRLATPSLQKIPLACQNNSATSNRRFEFQKRRHLFIRSHNETLTVAAICVRNPDRSPLRING